MFLNAIYFSHSNLHTIKLGTEIGELTHKGWNPKEWRIKMRLDR